MIRNNISSVFCESLLNVLNFLNIEISDLAHSSTIELLIGDDVTGKLNPGRKVTLKFELEVKETFLGWTLMGNFYSNREHIDATMGTIPSLTTEGKITGLLQLDVFGIRDLVVKKTLMKNWQ